MFDAMPILTAKNAFDYARISKIVLSGKNIVRFLAPLVVFEDNHLLVIFKPAGILSQSDKTGDLSVNEIFAAYLKEKYQKPGRVFCAAVQRLDRPASGLMALARTSKAAARLSEEIRATRFKKRYRVFTEKKLIGGPRAVLTAAMEKQSTKSGFKATLQTQNNSSLYVVSTRLVRSQHGVHEYDVSIDTGKFH
ncbi:MAG TPA: pseudouridine synthase, partial [Turneriella sp.]|nr:pseudouridine synthase [Turneriella sp.]